MLPDILVSGPEPTCFSHLDADGFEVEPELLQHIDRNALAELDQAEEQVLRADVIMIETVRLFAGQGQDLLGAGGEVIHVLGLSFSVSDKREVGLHGDQQTDEAAHNKDGQTLVLVDGPHQARKRGLAVRRPRRG